MAPASCLRLYILGTPAMELSDSVMKRICRFLDDVRHVLDNQCVLTDTPDHEASFVKIISMNS
jgi:hypothetical protein